MELNKFKIIVLPLRERLLNISLKLLENREDAEDVVQEIFLKLWRIRDSLAEYNSVEALAVTMTKNLSLDKLRLKKIQEDESVLQKIESGIKSPVEQLEQADAVACIRILIERLPTLQQQIIRMKDVEGYELAEIAEITGTKIEAVRSNLSRARKKVREQFIALNQEQVC